MTAGASTLSGEGLVRPGDSGVQVPSRARLVVDVAYAAAVVVTRLRLHNHPVSVDDWSAPL